MPLPARLELEGICKTFGGVRVLDQVGLQVQPGEVLALLGANGAGKSTLVKILFGGRGSVWGTLLAVLLLGTLNNGLTLLDVSSFWQDVTRGGVLLVAIGLDQLRSRVMGE